MNLQLFYSDYKDKITTLQASVKKYVLKRWKKDDGIVRLDQKFFASEDRTSLFYITMLFRVYGGLVI